MDDFDVAQRYAPQLLNRLYLMSTWHQEDDGELVWNYMHMVTRRNLHLDASGRAWRNNKIPGVRWNPVQIDLAQAIAYAAGDTDDQPQPLTER